MSTNNEEIDDDFDSDREDGPSQPSGQSSKPNFSSMNGKAAAGNMGLLEGNSSPFNEMNFGMGAGSGGGMDRFGSNMMGMRSGNDGHMKHSSDLKYEKSFLNEFEKTGFFGGKEEKKDKKGEKLEPMETEEERLLRLSKKLEIPEKDQITIVDWAIRGSAELIRLVLEYILIPYKERKYVYKTKDQWFGEDRDKLREKHPEVELPYIEDGERLVCGIEAIIVYVLHKYNRTELLGVNLDEKIKVATCAEIYWDIIEDYYVLCYGEYEEGLNWEKAKEKFINQKFRLNLNRMASCLKYKRTEEETEFYWVDFALAETISVLNEMDYRFKDQNSYLQNYIAKVFELPQWIVYRRSTRFHERPYNGLGAVYK